jgi:hypothetical protein
MSSFVQVLSSENSLSKPKQPGFFLDSPEADASSRMKHENTVFDARQSMSLKSKCRVFIYRNLCNLDFSLFS